MTAPEALLSVRGLAAGFGPEADRVRALEDLSFDVAAGEVVGLVGPSGAGKTVAARTVLGLLPGVTVSGGTAMWRGEDLLSASPARRRAIRGGEIALVFQDALSALNPVLPVGHQVAEVLRVHEGLSRRAASGRAVDALAMVGIADPRACARRHPHELSGGMRQRVLIAMALACGPALLIADEPTSALDVTVQAQVLDVLRAARHELGTAILLITHDLGVVAGLADRVVVVDAGRTVEEGPVDEVLATPTHPTTRRLLAAARQLSGGAPT